MRISDWSSDVCSSDLGTLLRRPRWLDRPRSRLGAFDQLGLRHRLAVDEALHMADVELADQVKLVQRLDALCGRLHLQRLGERAKAIEMSPAVTLLHCERDHPLRIIDDRELHRQDQKSRRLK